MGQNIKGKTAIELENLTQHDAQCKGCAGMTCRNKMPKDNKKVEECCERCFIEGTPVKYCLCKCHSPKEEKKELCCCGEQELLGGADVEIGGICHGKSPCYYVNQEDKDLNGVVPSKEVSGGWEEVFDKGFVWEKCCRDHYALFRVTNEADWEQHPLKEKLMGMRNLAHPDYIKAFIKVLLTSQKKEMVEAWEKIYFTGVAHTNVEGESDSYVRMSKEAFRKFDELIRFYKKKNE